MRGAKLLKVVKPPSAKHRGTRLRLIPPFLTAMPTFQESFSTARGIPEADEKAMIERTEDGALKPSKITATCDRYKVKLQEPAHEDAFWRLEEFEPTRGLGAARLMLSVRAVRHRPAADRPPPSPRRALSGRTQRVYAGCSHTAIPSPLSLIISVVPSGATRTICVRR